MWKIMKKCGVIIVYLLFMSVFFGFQVGKLFDPKQFFIFLGGTGLLFLPSLGEKTKEETKAQKLRHVSFCALWAGSLESLLLCLAAMEHMSSMEEVMPGLALCLRPILYGVCIWGIFADDTKEETASMEQESVTGGREITAGESYVIFQEMGLTRRECEVAVLICQGMSNGEIAENLCISEATVKKHVSNIFEKLGCSRREQIRGKLFS